MQAVFGIQKHIYSFARYIKKILAENNIHILATKSILAKHVAVLVM